jgi:hypothetical protein
MATRLLRKYCVLDTESMELLKHAVTNLNVSARGYDRILKVARTIPDLAGATRIQVDHLAEAVQYRAIALFLCPDGLLSRPRKLMPTALERLVWGLGHGSTLPVFDTPAGKKGCHLLGKLHASPARGNVCQGEIWIVLRPEAFEADGFIELAEARPRSTLRREP